MVSLWGPDDDWSKSEPGYGVVLCEVTQIRKGWASPVSYGRKAEADVEASVEVNETDESDDRKDRQKHLLPKHPTLFPWGWLFPAGPYNPQEQIRE